MPTRLRGAAATDVLMRSYHCLGRTPSLHITLFRFALLDVAGEGTGSSVVVARVFLLLVPALVAVVAVLLGVEAEEPQDSQEEQEGDDATDVQDQDEVRMPTGVSLGDRAVADGEVFQCDHLALKLFVEKQKLTEI